MEKMEPSYIYWWEFKLVQPLRKTIWKFLRDTKNRATIWSSNPTPGYISGKEENSNLKRYIHLDIYSSTIYNSKDMETTQVPANRWLASEDVVYTHTHTHTHIYNGIFLSHKKEWNIGSCSNMDKCREYYT